MKRILSTVGAIALATSGVLAASAGSASAGNPCNGWDSHPDLYHGGDVHFVAEGTKIRRGPYERCWADGEGYKGMKIDVHCYDLNAEKTKWFYVRAIETGVKGWVRYDGLAGDRGAVPRCV